MNVYTCTDFQGHYPVGTSAVVVAENVSDAWKMLTAELEAIGLPQDEPLKMVRLGLSTAKVLVLQNGNY